MRKLTTEQFIEKSKLVHGERYDYSLVEFVNTRTKVVIICNKHGEFKQNSQSHIYHKQGCPSCGLEQKAQTILTTYGVNNISQSQIIKNKKQETTLKKYGVNNISQCEAFQDKKKKTNNEKYGGWYVLPHMTDILPTINNRDWLYNQYIENNNSPEQIAKMLGISPTTIIKYLKKHDIEIKQTSGYSIKCIQWLESIMIQEDIFIQHAGNGGEYYIPGTRFKVDGYCKETNTIYEFHGDCFHGNPDLFEYHKQCNPFNDLTAKELYDNTIKRENKIKELGFNLVVMWENDFNKR